MKHKYFSIFPGPVCIFAILLTKIMTKMFVNDYFPKTKMRLYKHAILLMKNDETKM